MSYYSGRGCTTKATLLNNKRCPIIQAVAALQRQLCRIMKDDLLFRPGCTTKATLRIIKDVLLFRPWLATTATLPNKNICPIIQAVAGYNGSAVYQIFCAAPFFPNWQVRRNEFVIFFFQASTVA